MRSFAHLMSCEDLSEHRYVELSEVKFMNILRIALMNVTVDEAWYLSAYPDVAAAIQSGSFRSARQHYIASGYFEDRIPRHVPVDEAWYSNEYADVAAAIRAGVFTSAQQHFEVYGFKEGRLPSRNWSLLGNQA